jgi:hypothetical protein
MTNVPARAMWLYGPIGIGVFGGVLVSTFGIGFLRTRAGPLRYGRDRPGDVAIYLKRAAYALIAG